jgi:hypothetical protein
MKTVISAIAFVAVAAVSAYAYPPVTEPAGDESPAIVTDDEASEVANLTDPCVSRSVWCMEEAASEETMVSEEVDDDAEEPEVFGDMYAADPDEGESYMYMSALHDTENPDGGTIV